MCGEEVFFLTGVDQHGQKVQQKAEAAGMQPQEYADMVTQKFIALWERLGIQYDGWAATTDARHKSCVQAILSDLKEKGCLYKKGYKGFYSFARNSSSPIRNATKRASSARNGVKWWSWRRKTGISTSASTWSGSRTM